MSKQQGNGSRREGVGVGEAGATNLGVVVGADVGEAAGGGVEIEAEHRLLVIPVHLQCPARIFWSAG